MIKYVALLRGINVGGKNIVKMSELKSCFEIMGFCDVTTFIQSGNVVFSTDESNVDKLTDKIEKALSTTFDYNSRVVVVSYERLKFAVEHAPSGFGKDPARYRYDVVFLKEPISPAEAIKSVSTKEGVDEAFAGADVIYFARLISKATQSRLPRLIAMPVYQNMTIRNWNTTTTLLRLMEANTSYKTRIC